MNEFLQAPSTAFEGSRRLASGPLGDVALAVQAAQQARPDANFLTFDDTTGKVIDLDLRGSADDAICRLVARGEAAEQGLDATPASKPAGRGRPKLGVVAREVTLLPRHWDWLAAQSGGASQTLRRLVDQARNAAGGRATARATQEACYRFMSAMAGDLPHFEDASRALFAGDRERLARLANDWPPDVRDHTLRMAGDG